MRIILTTVGDDSQADKLANEILKRKMAACVSKIPIKSKYWWKGVLE
ncbi:divalent cation tolerance protein CutA, partial [bacterium]|nr:divalent cation tolerance protein CutA [bacterium]